MALAQDLDFNIMQWSHGLFATANILVSVSCAHHWLQSTHNSVTVFNVSSIHSWLHSRVHQCLNPLMTSSIRPSHQHPWCI